MMKDVDILAALVGVRGAMAEDFTSPSGEPTDELAQLDAVIVALEANPPLAEVEGFMVLGDIRLVQDWDNAPEGVLIYHPKEKVPSYVKRTPVTVTIRKVQKEDA